MDGSPRTRKPLGDDVIAIVPTQTLDERLDHLGPVELGDLPRDRPENVRIEDVRGHGTQRRAPTGLIPHPPAASAPGAGREPTAAFGYCRDGGDFRLRR